MSDNPYKAPLELEATTGAQLPAFLKTADPVQMEISVKSRASFFYLVLLTIGAFGFLWCFVLGPSGHRELDMVLFFPGWAAFIATITFAIWIHPVACLFHILRTSKSGASTKKPLTHLIWSLAVASLMFYLVFLNPGDMLQA
ncbi:MAG: hypothetical protein O2856_07535 [Planctomycetota bacterium]|nr:hypothetical protein [Planctomycetota bacterium]